MQTPDEQFHKLSIAQVIDVFEQALNGAGISTQRFTRLLRNDGYKVIVLATGEKNKDKVVLQSYYPPFSYFKKIIQRMRFVLARPDKKKIRAVFEQVDVVHNQFPLWLGMVAVRIANQMNKPLVSTFHVQGEQLMHNAGFTHPFWTKLAYKIMIHFIYNKSDIVICPSKFAEEEIKRYGLKRPTVVISNGVVPEYHPIKIEKKYPDKFTILSVGRNATEKRQELIIRALAASPYKDQIQLIILGDGPLRDKLVQLSNELLDGKVEFNLVAQQELIEYYNTSDLYVHAAAVEVECMTAIEAMACGIPLLIADSELSATKQFALNENFLYKTQEELTDKINYWFNHQEELKIFRTEYLNNAQQYDIKKSYQKLIDTYNKALEMHGQIVEPALVELQVN